MKMKYWLHRMTARVSAWLAPAPQQAAKPTRNWAPPPAQEDVPIPVKRVVSEPVPEPSVPASKRGRPISNSMARAIEQLSRNPEVTPAELAQSLHISRDYARTLLRRARTKITEDAAVQKRVATPPRKVVPTEALSQAAAPVQPVNQRSQILRSVASGDSPADVAVRLGVPVGEVEFILKVDRLLRQPA